MEEIRNDIPPQAPADGGLTPNLVGLLCYITIIPAIIFLVIAPYNRDRFVRFHAWQSLIFGIAAFVIHMILMFIPIIGWAISGLLGILFLILWIVAMLKAFQGQEWKIPIVGNIAAQQASKSPV